MIPLGREAQIRMYLSVKRARYIRPHVRRHQRWAIKVRECLTTHAAGCGCWQRDAGGARGTEGGR